MNCTPYPATTGEGWIAKFVPDVDRARLNDPTLTNEEILGHELKYAYNRKHNMQGKGYTDNRVPHEEIDAVNFQNIIRKKQGLKPRTTFAKKDISKFLVPTEEYNNLQRP